jgi:hypothetical protein
VPSFDSKVTCNLYNLPPQITLREQPQGRTAFRCDDGASWMRNISYKLKGMPHGPLWGRVSPQRMRNGLEADRRSEGSDAALRRQNDGVRVALWCMRSIVIHKLNLTLPHDDDWKTQRAALRCENASDRVAPIPSKSYSASSQRSATLKVTAH